MTITYSRHKAIINYSSGDSSIIDGLPEDVQRSIRRGLIPLSEIEISEFFTEEELQNLPREPRE